MSRKTADEGGVLGVLPLGNGIGGKGGPLKACGVLSGTEAGAGGGTLRASVGVGESDAGIAEGGDVGGLVVGGVVLSCGGGRAVGIAAVDVGPAEVVGEDKDDVGRLILLVGGQSGLLIEEAQAHGGGRKYGAGGELAEVFFTASNGFVGLFEDGATDIVDGLIGIIILHWF